MPKYINRFLALIVIKGMQQICNKDAISTVLSDVVRWDQFYTVIPKYWRECVMSVLEYHYQPHGVIDPPIRGFLKGHKIATCQTVQCGIFYLNTLVFLINVQARLFFGGSISPLHTHFYLVPARLLGTTYILIRPTLPISRLHAYLSLHVY